MNDTLALPQSAHWVESQISVECRAEEIAKALKHAKKTGQLIIHFTQGTVGGIVWREKVNV
jgi:hypothetical protein